MSELGSNTSTNINSCAPKDWREERELLLEKLLEERNHSSDLTRRLQEAIKESEKRKHEATKAAQEAKQTIDACNVKIQRLMEQRDLERSHYQMQLAGASRETKQTEVRSTECQTPRRFMPDYQPKSKNKRRTKASTLPSSNDLWPAKYRPQSAGNTRLPLNPWGEPVQSPNQRKTYPPQKPYSTAFEFDPNAPAFDASGNQPQPPIPVPPTSQKNTAQINKDILNQMTKGLLRLNTHWKKRLEKTKRQTEHHKQREQSLRRDMMKTDGWIPPKTT